MTDFGIALLIIGSVIGNFIFWFHMNLKRNWNNAVCLFMAFGAPFIIGGLAVLIATV